jgi:hypothetical protein
MSGLGAGTERPGLGTFFRSRLLPARHRHNADEAVSKGLSPRAGDSRRSP